MRPETMAALDRVNRRFYSQAAREFDATRKAPWPAWDRVLDRYRACVRTAHPTHSILDVGCGNGRFADFAAGRLDGEISFVGIDRSEALAVLAASGAPGRRSLVLADVVNRPLPLDRRSARFDLTVVFGLMHHVPSWERRRSLLVELAALLSRDTGLMAVSFWQFGAHRRFRNRFVDWSVLEEDDPEGRVDRSDLEPGDCLLRWGDAGALRYCHFADPAEAAELTAASGLARVGTFRGDGTEGRLNLYHLLQWSPSDGV